MTESVDSFAISEPPVLTLSAPRTVCEKCKAPLSPTVYHVCPGNAHWHPAEPEPPVMNVDQRNALMFALKACDNELFMVRDSVEGRVAIHGVRKTIADALIKGVPV
jgi:hypothetical protein